MREEDFVKFIREKRKELGWTQEKMAEAALTTPADVSKIETGKRQLSLYMLIGYIEGLGYELTVQKK